MTIFDVLLPYQQKFVTEKSRKKIWVSSRQIGKSFTLSFIAVLEALRKKNSLVLCISTGSRASEELLKKCQSMALAAQIKSNNSITFTSTSDTIKFNNGSRIFSLPSGNANALRGWTSDCTIIDECAFIERPEEVYESIVPTITRNPESKLIIASTPAGCNGLFYDLCNDESFFKQETTIYDAVKDGLKIDIEELKRTVGNDDVFQQEYNCRFSKEFDQMIDDSLLQFHDDDIDSQTRYFAADIGRTNDSTAILIGKSLNQKVYIDDIILLKNQEYEKQLNLFRDLYASNQIRLGYIDATGIGSAVAEFAQKNISAKLKGWKFTGANKTPMYERIRDFIFQRKISFNRKFEKLLKEDFRNTKRITESNGNVRYTAQRNAQGHSDIVSALSLLLQAYVDSPDCISRPTTYIRQSVFH